MAKSNVAAIRPQSTSDGPLAFGIPGGKPQAVPYVDENRDRVDALTISAMQSAIELIDNSASTHLVSDVLRLARDRIEAEKGRIRRTAYTGEVQS